MTTCPNINSQEWIKLEAKFGKDLALFAYNNNNNEIPTVEVAEQLIKNPKVIYDFKANDILLSDKAKQVFDKGNKNNWSLDKILTELAIPKEQKTLLLDLGITDREQLALELASKYAFSVEINTAKGDKTDSKYEYKTVNSKEEQDNLIQNGWVLDYSDFDGNRYKKEKVNNSQHFPYLSARDFNNEIKYRNNPDWEYQELAIQTPLIQNISNAHIREFSNGVPNMLGWVRVWYNKKTGTVEIQEVQSDLFQKGRDKEYLDKNAAKDIIIPIGESTLPYINQGYYVTDRDDKNITLKKDNLGNTNENQFLQLLNKDSNWVTFFIKSIIQDSAKKGYEKVLFPKGETAAKIEGHETIAGEIRKVDNEISEAKEAKKLGNLEYLAKDEDGREGLHDIDEYIAYKEQQKVSLKSQGIEKLKPIEAFYEIKVGNILDKQFGKENVKTITDEYGNQWRELEIKPERDLQSFKSSKSLLSIAVDNHIQTSGFFLKSADKRTLRTILDKNNYNYIQLVEADNKDRTLYLRDHKGRISYDRLQQSYKSSISLDALNRSKLDNPNVAEDVNRLLSFYVLKLREQDYSVDALKKEGQTTNIKLYIVNKLDNLTKSKKSKLTESEKNLLTEVKENILTNKNNTWSNFLSYLEYKYGTKLTKEYSEFIEENEFAEIKEDWDGSKIFNEIQTTFPVEVKMAFATIIDGKAVSTLGASMPLVIDIDDVFTGLIHYHRHDNTIDDVLKTLDKLNTRVNSLYGQIAQKLQDSRDLNTDLKNNFANAYMQVIKHQIQQNNIISIRETNTNGKAIEVYSRINNKGIDPNKDIADQAIDDILFDLNNTDNKQLDVVLKVPPFIIDDNINVETQISSAESIHEATNYLKLNVPFDYIDAVRKEYIALITNGKDVKTHELTNTIIQLIDAVKLLNESKSKKKKGIKVKTIDPRLNASMYKLVNLLEMGFNKNPNLGYSNVHGKIEYSAQQSNYLTKLFKQYSLSNPNTILGVNGNFTKFTQVPNLKHSNLLWKQFPGDPSGIFTPIFTTINKNTIPKLHYYTITNGEPKETTSDKATYTLYKINENDLINNPSAVIDIEKLNSLAYSLAGGRRNELKKEGSNYDELIGASWDFNVIADYMNGVATNKIHRMPVPASDSGRGYTLGVSISANSIIKDNNVELSDRDYNKVINTLLQEFEEMRVTHNAMFNNNGEFIGDANKLHSKKQGKLKDGTIVVGNVFKFNNLSYIENGKKVTLDSHLSKYSTNPTSYTIDEFRTDKQIKEFIQLAINKNVNDTIKHFNKLKSTIFLVKIGSDKDANFFKDENKTEQFNNLITNFYIDNYINNVEFGNFIYGSNNEYNDVLDWNKRVGQFQRPGQQHFDGTFTQLTIDEIKQPSKLLDTLLKNVDESIKKAYRKNIDVADGFSVITLDEYIKRLISAGRYAKYKPLIDKLKANKQLSVNEHTTFIESQKWFFYSREVNYKGGIPTLNSYQFKNSTMVLVPQYIQGTQWEQVYDYMMDKDVKVDQINLNSATKVGGVNTVSIFKNDKFVAPDKNIVAQIKTNHSLTDLYIQQDMPSHIIDDTDTFGSQLRKIIMNELSLEGRYKYKDLTGKELFDEFQSILSANIDDSAQEILDELQASDGLGRKLIDEKGYINYDVLESLVINSGALTNMIKRSVLSSTDNINMLSSFETVNGDIALPIDASVNTPKFLEKVLSAFTKKIIQQQLPGMALALVPEVFYKPAITFANAQDVKNFFNDSNYSFTNDFKSKFFNENGEYNGTKFELAIPTEDVEGNLTGGFEAIINPFLLKHIKLDSQGRVDINKLDKELLNMIGIRIPTEGKQSVVYMKVVGFINSGASQVILPYDLNTVTGWDYDIDKLFVYYKNSKLKNGKFRPVNEDGTVEEKYIDFIKEKLGKNHDKSIFKVSIDRKEILDPLIARYDYFIEKPTGKNITKLDFSNALNNYIDKLNTILGEYYIIKNGIPNATENSFLDTLDDLLFFVDSEISNEKSNPNLITNLQNNRQFLADLSDLFFGKVDNNSLFDKAKIIATNMEFPTFNEFKGYDKHKQLTRGVRENQLIDIMKSVITSKHHRNNVFKANDFTNLNNVSNHVNEIAGFKVDVFNQNNYADNSKLRTLNLQTRVTKGISVATDALLNILGSINANFKEVPLIPVDITHLGITDKKELTSRLNILFGEDNYKIPNGDLKYVFIADKYIANNFKGTSTDITGFNHSKQLSEVTANILDAVTKLMFFNFNKHTIGIFKTMTVGSLSHRDNITKEGNNEYNKFIYPIMFLSQPAIADYLEIMNLAITYPDNSDNSINSTENIYNRKFLTDIFDRDIEISDAEGNTKTVKGKALLDYVRRFTTIQLSYDAIMTNLKIEEGKPTTYNVKDYALIVKVLKEKLKLNNSVLSLENLNAEFTNYHKGKTDYKNIAFQLDVINTFRKYHELSKHITKAVNTINLDKSSISSAAEYKMNDNLINSVYTTSVLKNTLRSIVHKINDHNIISFQTTNKLIDSYNKAKTVKDKYDILQNIESVVKKAIGTSGIKNLTFNLKESQIQVKDVDLFKAIFPKAFGINEKSVYPTQETFYMLGQTLAKNTISKNMVFDAPIYAALKNKIFEDINSLDYDSLDRTINNFILVNLTSELPHIKQYNDDLERLLGINELGTTVDINGISIDDLTEQSLNKFNKLSLTSKIRAIQDHDAYKSKIKDDRYKGAHILNNITLVDSDTNHSGKPNKYKGIKYIRNESNQNIQIFSFLELLDNENPYLRSIGNDLIAYNYFVNGFKFGNNISKVIPVQAYHYSQDEYNIISNYNDSLATPQKKEEYNSLINSFKGYAKHVRTVASEAKTNKLQIIADEEVLKLRQQFYQTLGDDNLYKLLSGINYDTAFKVTAINSTNYDAIELEKDDNYNLIAIYGETLLNNDHIKFANKEFVVYKEDKQNKLYKRIERTKFINGKNRDIFIYYPISRKLTGEINETVIQANIELSETKYLSLIDTIMADNTIIHLLSGKLQNRSDDNRKYIDFYSIPSAEFQKLLPVVDLTTIDDTTGEETEMSYYDYFNNPANSDQLSQFNAIEQEYISFNKFYGHYESLNISVKEVDSNNYPKDQHSIKKVAFAIASEKPLIIHLNAADKAYTYNYETEAFKPSTQEELDKANDMSLEEFAFKLAPYTKYGKDIEAKGLYFNDFKQLFTKTYNLEGDIKLDDVVKLFQDDITSGNVDDLKFVVDIVNALNNETFRNRIKNKSINYTSDQGSNKHNFHASLSLDKIALPTSASHVSNIINNLSDVTLHIGKPGLDYNALQDKDKVIQIDNTGVYTGVLDKIKSKIGNLNTANIGIIGQIEGTQEEHNTFITTLLNAISYTSNVELKVITNNRPGVAQAAKLNGITDVLVLDTDNQFDAKANYNYHASSKLSASVLTDDQKQMLDSLKLSQANEKNIHSILLGLHNGLSIPTEIRNSVTNDTLNTIRQKLEIAANAIKGENIIQSIVQTSNYKSMEVGFKQLLLNNSYIHQFIAESLTVLDTIDYETLFANNDLHKQQVTNMLATSTKLYQAVKYVDSLRVIPKPDEMAQEEYEKFNKYVSDLKAQKAAIDKLQVNIEDHVQRYIGTRIFLNSSNPNYKTDFDNTRNKIKEHLRGTKFENVELTNENLVNIITQSLSGSEDINQAMFWLDSSFQTGVTVVDNMMSEYFDIQSYYKRRRDGYVDELTTILGDYFGDKKLVESIHHIDTRTNLFKNYIDSQGELISDVKWSDFKNDYFDLQYKVGELQLDYSTTTEIKRKEQLAKEINALTRNWLKDNVDGVNTDGTFSIDIIINKEDTDKIEDVKKQFNNDGRFKRYLATNRLMEIKQLKGIRSEAKYIRLKPNKKYENKYYNSLNDKDKALISDLRTLINKISKENLDGYIVDNNLFPKILQPELIPTLKQMAGINSIGKIEDHTFVGINGAVKYYNDLPFIQDYDFYTEANIRDKKPGEKVDDYITDVLLTFSNWYKSTNKEQQKFIDEHLGTPKTIKDLYKFNRKVREFNAKKTAEGIIRDPFLVINQYATGTSNYKAVNTFYDNYTLLLAVLESDDFSVKNPKGTINRLKSAISKKPIVRDIKGADSKVTELIQNFAKVLFDIPLQTTKFEQVLGGITGITGTTYMSLNVLGGIKNTTTGFANMVSVAGGGGFIGVGQLHQAAAEYMGLIGHILNANGSETSDNLQVAFMKHASWIFEDTGEAKSGIKFNNAAGKARWLYDASYFANNSTEHFMQYAMLLGNLKSQKVLDGKIVTKFDIDNTIAYDTILEVLSESERKQLSDFMAYKKKNNQNEIEDQTYVSEWIAINQRTLAPKMKEIANKIEDYYKKAKTLYESLPTVESQFELVNGRPSLKKDSTITLEEYTAFERRVQVLNQKIHGIYNTIDKNMLQQNIYGSMVMQFKKWMRPMYNTYWGTKLNSSVYDENLRTYNTGAYKSLFNFLVRPLKNKKYKDEDGELIIRGFSTLMADWGYHLMHLRLNYKTLGANDKRNVKMALANITQLFVIWALASVAVGLAGDDEEEQKEAIDDSKALALMLYVTYGTSSDIASMLPNMLGATLSKMKENISASEGMIENIYNLVSVGITYPFMDEDEQTYDRGIYKDEDKFNIALQKVTPVLRQYNKLEFIESYANWYKQYSPLSVGF